MKTYETNCSEILDLFRAAGEDVPHEDSDMGRAVQILQEICDSQGHSVPDPDMEGFEIYSTDDIFVALEEIESHIGDDDFYLEFDGNEYRIISEADIWEIYVEEIKNLVEGCYELNFDKIPNFIAVSVDWEQTAKNAYVDGYGHTFSSYDHSEVEAAGYYIFRTN